MSKALIKVVIREQWPTSILAVHKFDSESKTDLVPCVAAVEGMQDEATRAAWREDERWGALHDVRSVVQDAGIKFHAYGGNGIDTLPGSALAAFALKLVRRSFVELPHCDTFCLLMDKPTVPRAKQWVQEGRSTDLEKQMRIKSIAPIRVDQADLPLLIDAQKPMPAWLAVRANRVAYTLALGQLFALIERSYCPPPGCRLVLDYMPLCAVLPQTVDEWLRGERIVFRTERARKAVERMRETLRSAVGDWRGQARRFVVELARAHELAFAPICIETSLDNRTWAPFVLLNAANACGEADVGALFWLDALTVARRHETFVGERRARKVEPLDESLLEFYTAEQRVEHEEAMQVDGNDAEVDISLPFESAGDWSPIADITTPHAERVRSAKELIAECERACDDIYADQCPHTGLRVLCDSTPLLRTARALVGTKRVSVPNRSLLMSSDTDFLALAVVWQAQHGERESPLLSIGPQAMVRCGLVNSIDDFFEKPKKKTVAPPTPSQTAHEIFDVARLTRNVVRTLREARGSSASPRDLVAQFAAYCASCANDYLKGLGFVNRKHMFKAFIACGANLGPFENDMLHLDVHLYALYIKRCYFESQQAARKKHLFLSRFGTLTYARLSDHMRSHLNDARRFMPTADALALMFERTQWWLSYVQFAHSATPERVLDERVWGWQEHNKDVRV